VLFKKQAVKAEMEGTSISAGWIADSPLGKIAAARGAVAAVDALAALDKAEAEGLYDHWLAAYLWRRTTSPSASFYARLEQHARVTDALLLARGQVKPPSVSPRAWASKAGPGHAQRVAWDTFVKDVLKTAHDEYPRTEPGTWKRDGVILFAPMASSPAPSVVQGGKVSPLAAGTRFGRLDLLVTPKAGKSAVTHEWLGRIDLPAATTLSVWSLEAHLPPEARRKIDEAVKAALDGDEKAALQLERAMPLAHRALRDALAQNASAKGAPRLRTILALFDDIPMSPPVDPMPSGD
jgi:hypothetical protein